MKGLDQELRNPQAVDVLGEVRSRIERFTARNLSYQSDSLNAFTGNLNHYRSRTPATYHYWGLPVNFPEQAFVRKPSEPLEAFFGHKVQPSQ